MAIHRTDQPKYGQRLLINVVDEIAQQDPNSVFWSIPKSSRIQDGFNDITYAQLATAVDRAAWWLQSRISDHEKNITIAYMGPNDIRFPIVLLAVLKLGHKIFWPSPRNSAEAFASLLKATDCKIFLTARSTAARVETIASPHPGLQVHTFLDVSECLDKSAVDHFPYAYTLEEVQDQPALVLHTSGSTGIPKPITMTHSYFMSYDVLQLLPPVDGRDLAHSDWFSRTRARPLRLYTSLPLFHAAGVFTTMLASIYYGSITIIGPPDRPLSIDLADDMNTYAPIEAAFYPPFILEEISQSPASLEKLARIQTVYTGTAPISKSAGDAIAAKTYLINQLGTTEAGIIPFVKVDREDWMYFHFHPWSGVVLRPYTEDLFEVFIVRDEQFAQFRPVFTTFPDLQEFPMHDLYQRHPMKPDLWVNRGRSDDIMVLSNGEKLNPLTMEETVNRHPDVHSCMVVGERRFQPALLIELNGGTPTSPQEKSEMVDKIWPAVEEANDSAPNHGRITKNHIIFARSDLPFQWTPKGTLRRKMVLKDYQGDIDQLYATAEDFSEWEGPQLEIPVNTETLAGFVRKLVEMHISISDFDDEDDFFALGIDSLRIAQMSGAIKVALRSNCEGLDLSLVAPRLLYANPTPSRLVQALDRIVKSSGKIEDEPREQVIKSLIEKYSSEMPTLTFDPSLSTPGKMTLIVTGTTGSLGSYLLSTLLDNPEVERVYCLNRSREGKKRQAEVNASRGLDIDLDTERTVFLHADFSQPTLGVPPDAYNEMLRTVTHIIHNAWPVDFNMSVSSFERVHIAGVRHFVDFSAASKNHAKILFASSIAVTLSWGAKNAGPVPERPIADTDFDVAESNGYAESKLVSEKLLERAAAATGIRHTVLRIGQIAGPSTEKGMWNKTEWLPNLIASSKYLSLLPTTLGGMGDVDWIPVDTMAKAIVELLQPGNGSEGENPVNVYHLVNPHAATWQDLVPAIRKYIAKDIRLVLYAEWVDALQHSDGDDLEGNPGVKLLDFYTAQANKSSIGSSGGATKLATTRTAEHSSSIAGLTALNRGLMEMWMRQWNF